MSAAFAPRAASTASASSPPSDALTHVELTHIEKRIENWIRFGHHVHEQLLDRRRRILSFPPGSIFAFVRWASNDFGTVASRLDIVRCVAMATATRRCPSCAPVARSCCGWMTGRRSRKFCSTSTPSRRSASIRQPSLPITGVMSPHRISVGFEPRAYSMERHRAWLKRQECGQ